MKATFQFFLILTSILIIKFNLHAQNEWPSWQGPFGNFTQLAPVGKQIVDNPSQIKQLWVSEEQTPPGAAQSPRYGGTGSDYELPGGGGYSPVAANGYVYFNYFKPRGPEYDLSEYSARTGTWDPNMWYIRADDIIVCIDIKDGRNKWRKVMSDKGYNWADHKGTIMNASPVLLNGKLYVIGSTARLYCLDAATGNLIWESTTIISAHSQLESNKQTAIANKQLTFYNRNFGGALSFADGILIVPNLNLADSDKGIKGVDPETGAQLWSISGCLGNSATPSRWIAPSGKEYVLVANSIGEIRCINPKTGAEVWKVTGAGNNEYTINQTKTHMFVNVSTASLGTNGVGQMACYQITETGATKKWTLASSWGYPNVKVGIIPLDNGNYIYMRSDYAAKFIIIKVSDGSVVSQTSLLSGYRVDEAHEYLVGDKLFIEPNSQHSLTNTDLFNGNPLSFTYLGRWDHKSPQTTSYSTPFSHPVIDGKVFVRSGKGIVAWDITKDPTPISVSLTNPSVNTVYIQGSNVSLSATSSVSSGNITKVEFYKDAVKIGEDLSSPYTYDLTNVQAGTYTITAKAYSDAGQSEESVPVLMMVKVFTSLSVDPATKTLSFNDSQKFVATATDQDGVALPSTFQPTISWQTSGGGTIDANGNFTAQTPGGPYTITASGTVGGVSKSGTATVTIAKKDQSITLQEIPGLLVSDPPYTVTVTASSGLPVTLTKISGNATVSGLSITPIGEGIIIVKASQAGNANYNAAADVYDTFRIKLTATLTSIAVTPNNTAIFINNQQQFSAKAYDQYGDLLLTQPSFSWSVNGGGTITSAGLFTAGSTIGNYSVSATATVSSVTKTGTSDFTITKNYNAISINYGATSLAATDNAGVIARQNWNNWLNTNAGTLSNLKDDKGTTTGASMYISSSSKYTTTDTDVSTGDKKMMQSYTGIYNIESFKIVLSGIPAAFVNKGYDVYVYWGNHESVSKTVEYKIRSTVYYIKDNSSTWNGTHALSTATTSATAVDGQNYIKFTGLTTDTFTLNIRRMGNYRVGISGLQIVSEDSQSGMIVTGNTTNIKCNGYATGEIKTSISGGNTPYTYKWNNALTTKDVNNLIAGIYSVTVTDNASNTSSASFTITQPTALNVNATITHVTVFNGTNGAINSVVSGGSTPYNYVWNTSASTPNISNLVVGNYSLTLTDANSCSATKTFVVSLATNEIEKTIDELSIGPNPSLDLLEISGIQLNSSIQLYNLSGVLVYSKNNQIGKCSLDLSDISSGTYILKISNSNTVKTIIISKK